MDYTEFFKLSEELDAEKAEARGEIARLKETIARQVQEQLERIKTTEERRDKAVTELLSTISFADFADEKVARALYAAGWDDGNGSRGWREAVNKMLTSMNCYLSAQSGGWMVDKNYTDPAVSYSWAITVPRERNLDDEKLENTVNSGLKEVLRTATKIRPETYVNIMENTLSEFGIYKLVLVEDTWAVVLTRYGSDSTLFQSDDLREVIKWMSRNCYYSSWAEDDEDESYDDVW